MILPKGMRTLIVFGVLFSGYVCSCLVMMNDHGSAWWTFGYGILFSLSLFCSAGLWQAKTWAWFLSLVLSAASLGLGIYFIHFAWTFWIFQEPSFFDRVFAVLHPRILIFTVFPIVWLIYFSSRFRYFHS